MSLWKRTMDYLGLGPDDAYDDYDGYDEPEAPRQQRAPRGQRSTLAARVRTRTRADGAHRLGPAELPVKDFDASPSRRARSVELGSPRRLGCADPTKPE